jgi:hypothetical protein
MAGRHTTTYGFKRTASLLGDRIRTAGESRGFAVSRVLTHWAEVVGTDLAAIARPVDVRYGRGRLGATLTLLCSGSNAPIAEMQKERIREKVNATYGYNAISQVRITQTSAAGFAEDPAAFTPPGPAAETADPRTTRTAAELAEGVDDDRLRTALERLGRQVLSKRSR